MGDRLSQKLAAAGFFCALGSTEYLGGQSVVVERGAPRRYDWNNGVSVVYDEDGTPWIKHGRVDLEEFGLDHWSDRGAHVPHSNDGGHFVREVLPGLMRSMGLR